MPVESASTISELDRNYPLSGDQTLQGDDHLRLIKQVLQDQFPGELGQGLTIPIVASETELNYLVGLTSNAQDQFDAVGVRLDGLEGALSAPVGTRMAFHQPLAPLGWLQDITLTNHMLRVVSGAGGADGGSDSPIDFSHNHTVPNHVHTTASHAISVNEMPAHTLDVQVVSSGTGSIQSVGREAAASTFTTIANAALTKGGSAAHAHGDTGSISQTISETTWTPLYVDVIICSKS